MDEYAFTLLDTTYYVANLGLLITCVNVISCINTALYQLSGRSIHR